MSISVEDAEKMKRLNKCLHVEQSSPRWEIYWGQDEFVLLPHLLENLPSDKFFGPLANQSIVIFESAEEAYLVLCQKNLVPEIVKDAILRGSETAFTWVLHLATSS